MSTKSKPFGDPAAVEVSLISPGHKIEPLQNILHLIKLDTRVFT